MCQFLFLFLFDSVSVYVVLLCSVVLCWCFAFWSHVVVSRAHVVLGCVILYLFPSRPMFGLHFSRAICALTGLLFLPVSVFISGSVPVPVSGFQFLFLSSLFLFLFCSCFYCCGCVFTVNFDCILTFRCSCLCSSCGVVVFIAVVDVNVDYYCCLCCHCWWCRCCCWLSLVAE